MKLLGSAAQGKKFPEEGKAVDGIGPLTGKAHALRVELDSKDRKGFVLKRFYGAVIGTAKGDPEVLSQTVDGLMMMAVDEETLTVQDFQKALPTGNNGVHGISLGPVKPGGGKMLAETSAQGYIQYLMPPADSQDRFSCGKEGFGEGQIVGVPLRGDFCGAVDLLSVKAGVQIPAAAEDQSVKVKGKGRKLSFRGNAAAVCYRVLIIRRSGAVEQ